MPQVIVDGYYDGDSRPADGSGSSGHGGHGASFGDPAPNSGKTASNGVQSAVDYANAISDYMDQYNQQQTDAVNAFNAKEAQKNRDWQEYMAKHAHQFEVADLIAAGLNPVLSAGGQGAFVGNGGVASGQKAVADNTRAQAAMALLNNALYSAGNVAAASAKAASNAETSTGANKASATWKDFVNWAMKAVGLGIAGARTALSWKNLRNSAKTVATAGQLLGTSVAYQTFTKKGVNTRYKYY